MEEANEMDEADHAFLASLLPDGAMSMGFIAGTIFVAEDGARCWKVYSQLDCSLTETLGLLELMKLEIIARCPGTLADLGFQT